MVRPTLTAWMKERDEGFRHAIVCLGLIRFDAVTSLARESQIGLDARAATRLGKNVFDREIVCRVRLLTATVLTAAASPRGDQTPNASGNLSVTHIFEPEFPGRA